MRIRRLSCASFYRQFPLHDVPEQYYRHLRCEITREESVQVFSCKGRSRMPAGVAGRTGADPAFSGSGKDRSSPCWQEGLDPDRRPPLPGVFHSRTVTEQRQPRLRAGKGQEADFVPGIPPYYRGLLAGRLRTRERQRPSVCQAERGSYFRQDPQRSSRSVCRDAKEWQGVSSQRGSITPTRSFLSLLGLRLPEMMCCLMANPATFLIMW